MLFAIAGAATGQDAKPAEIDIEARKASVEHLESYIKQRRERLKEVADEIIALDARIERRVAKTVDFLAGLKDSESSKTRVSKLKKEAIEGLQKGLDMYAAKRRELAEMAKDGNEAALDNLPALGKRIGTRVEQIVELSKSFPTGSDVAKYEPAGGSYWNGYYHETTRISNEWKQNRRDASQAKVVRDQSTEALNKAMERLDNRRAELVDNLENRNPSDSAKELYLQEIGQIDAFKTKLRAELVSLSTSDGEEPGATAASLEEVVGLERQFNDLRADLREDVSEMFRLYGAFIRERGKVQEMEKNLLARKRWLEEHAVED